LSLKAFSNSWISYVVGSQLGLITSILLGRTLLKPWISAKFSNSQTYKALSSAVISNTFNIIILLRISPLIPFGVANFLLSMVNPPLPIHSLIFPTFVGNIPGATLYSFVGSLMSSFLEDKVDLGGRNNLILGLVGRKLSLSLSLSS
jgi:uncharacterized membrane protein YdjX (TVP38/TMEM64 family)